MERGVRLNPNLKIDFLKIEELKNVTDKNFLSARRKSMSEYERIKMKERTSIKNVIRFAGAYIAYIIGSGFATGQEIIQFYTSYGYLSVGAILISMFFFAWVGSVVMSMGYDHKDQSEGGAYQRFCGKYLGTFYEYFVPFFLFCVVVIMISGAGATLNEYYGMNYYVGSLLMAVLIYVAYIFGLKGLVNIIGCIGPVIILFTVLVGAITLIDMGGNLGEAGKAMEGMSLTQAAPNWLLGGLSYAAYNIFGSIIFLNALGRTARTRREAFAGGAVGGIVLMTATLLMNLAFLADIGEVGTKSIPTLYLADKISPAIGVAFSVVLLAGIFSTAAPMTWTVCDRIVKEGTTKSKIVAGVIVTIAFFCGQLPFDKLVGTVYPYTGYLGILLFVCLITYVVREKLRIRATGRAEK